MNVQEMKRKKRLLEQQIAKLIDDFEESTELDVRSIYVISNPRLGTPTRETRTVEVEVWI